MAVRFPTTATTTGFARASVRRCQPATPSCEKRRHHIGPVRSDSVARPVPRQAGWPEPGVDAGGEVQQGRFAARIEAGANRQRLVAGDELRIP
jgi:hypothetical protein